ncbi:MAG: DEAD/DEAH box helicase [Candidatus Zixiibacteriota bacterium]|jgi:ATP-dependent Lhr-like helicase
MGASEWFGRLHKEVQRWVYLQGWTSLRDIQERAIGPILNAENDVVISASTAAGKTEAAFLPACSQIAGRPFKGFGILYVSPLKTLINDIFRRLETLSEAIDVPLTPWHGDVLWSIKEKQRKTPRGILLITPESLEALLLKRPSWCADAFGEIRYIIIDEFHAFIGTERGYQLLSLLHRLEFLTGRIIPRIALSATLSELRQVAYYLRPRGGMSCVIIESSGTHSDLKIQLRGYLYTNETEGRLPSKVNAIIKDLYRFTRTKSNLVFANSRVNTEEVATALSDCCKHDGVPNEFFPHHGNLSKELREDLEARLQKGKLPTTAVCTTTLELGIDIGTVDTIAQVTAPPSVASLRQRLGRSGRRGDPAVLRMFILEDEITTTSDVRDRLRLETFQSIAVVNLLLKKWYEPPPLEYFHLSTLLQQTLAVVAQYGGVRVNQLWRLLCDSGPFSKVDDRLYGQFLRALCEQELLTQTGDGQLIIGYMGEKLISHYTFYAVFFTPEEYRLEYEGRILGTIPIDKPLVPGQSLIFAGQRWEILSIDTGKKTIRLERGTSGKAPYFGGSSLLVHGVIRAEMYRVYNEKDSPVYLDPLAKSLFEEGIQFFHGYELNKTNALSFGQNLYLFPWVGDRIAFTLTMLLRREGLTADYAAGVIDIKNTTLDTYRQLVRRILDRPKPTQTELANSVPETVSDKYDRYLPKNIRDVGYGAKYFDIEGAIDFFSKTVF